MATRDSPRWGIWLVIRACRKAWLSIGRRRRYRYLIRQQSICNRKRFFYYIIFTRNNRRKGCKTAETVVAGRTARIESRGIDFRRVFRSGRMALRSICRLSIDSTFRQSSHFGATARPRQPFLDTLLRSIATAAKNMALPRVFFDMTADDKPVGRIVMEVSRN